MQTCLDEDWNKSRGFEVDHVGVSSISYTDDSQKLINKRNEGAMLSDPSIREGYVQGAIAEGIKSAGANTAGAGTAFMGVGMGMNAMGAMGAFSQTNAQQMQAQQAGTQAPAAGAAGAAGAASWYCPKCGTPCDGNFCPKCGTQKPQF